MSGRRLEFQGHHKGAKKIPTTARVVTRGRQKCCPGMQTQALKQCGDLEVHGYPERGRVLFVCFCCFHFLMMDTHELFGELRVLWETTASALSMRRLSSCHNYGIIQYVDYLHILELC